MVTCHTCVSFDRNTERCCLHPPQVHIIPVPTGLRGGLELKQISVQPIVKLSDWCSEGRSENPE